MSDRTKQIARLTNEMFTNFVASTEKMKSEGLTALTTEDGLTALAMFTIGLCELINIDVNTFANGIKAIYAKSVVERVGQVPKKEDMN